MKINYDKLADAMYIYLKEEKVAKTIKINDRVLVDVDSDGNLIGIEMLGVSKQIPKEEIGRIYTEMPVYT
ncbi:DUF2283 domain-containing protein [Patescibacteria group bacterium]|nr:DUF2283 domain-containing protein [Patescibacteria group bacterium]